MKKIKKYIVDSYEEMRYKVTWPTYREVQNSSVLVLIASLIFALVIWVIDQGFQNSLEWFYDQFN